MTSTEVVWDHDRASTASSGSSVIPAGQGTAWSGPLLLATAAGVSLLTTFIDVARAAGVPVLGYVAQQRPDVENAHDIGHLVITACISVPNDAAAAAARDVWTIAVETAPVLRALRCPLICEPHIVVLSDEALQRDGV